MEADKHVSNVITVQMHLLTYLMHSVAPTTPKSLLSGTSLTRSNRGKSQLNKNWI